MLGKIYSPRSPMLQKRQHCNSERRKNQRSKTAEIFIKDD